MNFRNIYSSLSLDDLQMMFYVEKYHHNDSGQPLWAHENMSKNYVLILILKLSGLIVAFSKNVIVKKTWKLFSEKFTRSRPPSPVWSPSSCRNPQIDTRICFQFILVLHQTSVLIFIMRFGKNLEDLDALAGNIAEDETKRYQEEHLYFKKIYSLAMHK